MNPKVAIALLAVIVLLFVGGVSCGATHGGDSSKPPSWTTTLQDLLVKKATASDLRADSGSCIQGASVVVLATRTCQFHVDDTRRVVLSPSQGLAAISLNPQHGFGGPQKPNADGGYDFTVNKGDTFSVTCVAVPGSSPCKLGLIS